MGSREGEKMELRQIQYFMQLYKDCNITKASQALFISQQGLSKAVNRLEAEVGFALFRRTSTGVIPMESAHKLYECFKKVQDSYQDLEREIVSIRRKKVLKMIAPTGFALATDINEFAEYNELYPEFEIRYEEEPQETMVKSMLEGGGDIAFMVEPIPEEFQSHQIVGREPLYAVINSASSLAEKDYITISDLEGQYFLFLNLYERYNEWILMRTKQLGIACSVYGQVAMNEFLSVLYTGKKLIGFSSKRLYQYYNFPGIVFLPFFPENRSQMYIESHLVTLKGISPSQEQQHYIDYMKEKYRDVF